MRLVTVRTGAGTGAGTSAARVDGDELVLLDAPDLGALLAGPQWRERAGRDGERRPYAAANLAPLIPRPPKIVCVGLNYASHIHEMGRELPTHPTLFAKFPAALIGARDDIVLPPVSDKVDWEAELAVVVGSPLHRGDAAAASACIAGYAVLNDVTARDWQRRTTQWLAGKTFAGTTPLGPELVTGEECDDAADLELRCEVDGEVVQRTRTADLVFSPADVLAYLSQILPLEPGDVVATGTPGGVGAGRDPQVFLRTGQVLRTVIEGLGECVNTCVSAA